MIGKVLGAAGAALAAAAIVSAPIAAALPNPGGGSNSGGQNANENAQSRGITIKDITVTKPVDTSSTKILQAIPAFAPNQAGPGLANALSHLPTVAPS